MIKFDSQNVRNQSFPYWNDGQTGVTTVSPPGGALCLFSACYLDNDNSRHFIAPTSCSVSSPTATQDGQCIPAHMRAVHECISTHAGSSLLGQSITQQTTTSDYDRVPGPSTTPEVSQSRERREIIHPHQGEQNHTKYMLSTFITVIRMSFLL